MQVDRGRFADVPLDGLRFGIVVAWPGPIHKGNGTLQAVIDERAMRSSAPRLEAIAHGKETEPGKLAFNETHAHLARVNWSTHGVVR